MELNGSLFCGKTTVSIGKSVVRHILVCLVEESENVKQWSRTYNGSMMSLDTVD